MSVGARREGGVELRLATLEDWAAFQRVYESIAAEGRWIGGELPIDWKRRRGTWEHTIADARWLVVVAAVGGELVGWISAEHQPHGRVDLSMGVTDGHRARGIGTQLMATAVGWAKQRGSHKVTLELWSHNDPARALYEKFGFVVEGHHRRHWRRNDGAIWDSLSMGLVLDESSPGGPGSPTDESHADGGPWWRSAR